MGEWQDDLQCGEGKCLYVDGAAYDGEWKDGKRYAGSGEAGWHQLCVGEASTGVSMELRVGGGRWHNAGNCLG